MDPLTLMLIGGGVGALAGYMKNRSSQDYSSSVNAGSATGNELYGSGMLTNSMSELQGMVGAGPGRGDVVAGTGAQRDLAAMLQQYAQGSYMPSQGDINSSNQLAGNLFQAQRVAMNQAFSDQETAANRQAALMGRTTSDPILRAKLAQEQTRQSSMLDAQQGSWAQQFALNQPMQRLGFAQQRVGVLGGLATQAMQNRQALASMGEALMNNERNFRLQTATRTGNQTTTSGGGLQGALTGMLGGAGTFGGIAAMMGNGGLGGGGGGGFTPGQWAPQYQAANNYFNGQMNPYSSMGAGLTYGAPAPQTGFAMPQMGSQFNGTARQVSLGGY